MKTLKKIVVVLMLTFISLSIQAQQLPMYTHYMYNTLGVNPAYAGSRDALTVTALHRSQWVGFEGAPSTLNLTLHSPIINQHIGVGLSVMKDKIGPIDHTSLVADFAYMMRLNSKSKLALGLSAGVNIMQANLSELELDQQSDPVFRDNINKHATPNVGAGAYYSRERFYAGISSPNLLQNTYSQTTTPDGTVLIAKEQRHYFLIAGSMIKLSDNLTFKPTTLIKLTVAVPAQIDVTASFIIMKKLLLGAMFRSGDAVGALIGLNVMEQLHIGYSYDWSYGLKSSTYNKGSHEVIVRYDFIFPGKKQVHSPRYF